MTDYISRQAAIDALNEYFARIGKLKRRGLTEGEKAISLDTVGAIKTLPSAQPIKHGKWLDMGDHEQCSACHSTHLKEFQSYYGKVTWVKTPYCPQCGAKMDGEEK